MQRSLPEPAGQVIRASWEGFRGVQAFRLALRVRHEVVSSSTTEHEHWQHGPHIALLPLRQYAPATERHAQNSVRQITSNLDYNVIWITIRPKIIRLQLDKANELL